MSDTVCACCWAHSCGWNWGVWECSTFQAGTAEKRSLKWGCTRLRSGALSGESTEEVGERTGVAEPSPTLGGLGVHVHLRQGCPAFAHASQSATGSRRPRVFRGGLLELHPEQQGGVVAPGGGRTTICEVECQQRPELGLLPYVQLRRRHKCFPSGCGVYLPTQNVAGLPAPACPRTWVADCSDPAVHSGERHRTPSAWHVLVLNGAECLSAAHQPRGHAPLLWACPRCLPTFLPGFCGMRTHLPYTFVFLRRVPGSQLPQLLAFPERRARGASFVTMFGPWSWVPEVPSRHQDQMCVLSFTSPFTPQLGLRL